MHLALKSAMSRIPYTNKVGETLSSIADPAAAYSLRALGGGDPIVARVRRSDNAEKDITASDISGGALVNWVGLGNDGFVTTWYDQSGNDNHATQGTAGSQPKIVDGGVLVSDGIDFDGVDDTLVVTGNPVITANYAGTYSAFTVQTVNTIQAGYIAGNASTINGSSLLAFGPTYKLTNKNNSNFDSISKATGKDLLSACYNNGDASLLVNGSGSMVDTGTYNFSAGTSDFRIGSRNPNDIFLEGKIQEIIIYDSDQSSNRLKIETNINNHYDIY